MYEYKCKVVNVVDGDTIDIDIDLGFDIILRNQRIRLHGIDTPEFRTSDIEEKKFGILARDAVVEFIKDKNTILRTLEYNDKGKFGRILGDIIVDGVSLVNMLIDKRLGVTYSGQSKELILEKHIENRKFLYESGIINTNNLQ